MVSTKTVACALLVFAVLGSELRAQVAFQPTVGVFPSGVQMQTTPVVSHDRRYVRIGVNPQFTDLIGFNTYSIPAAVSSGPSGPGALGGVRGLLSVGLPAGVNNLLDERTALGGKAIGKSTGPMSTDAAIARAIRARASKAADRPELLEIRTDRPIAAARGRQKAKIQP